jgi:hypothetical protein
MKRAIVFAAVVCAAWCSHAMAGSWAEGLFSDLRYDFGNVPRGNDVAHEFVVTNNTGSPVRISGMRRTCGCTLVTLDDKPVMDQNLRESSDKKLIPPGQQARIGVVLDTRNFLREKSSEITVLFDQPAPASVRLTVTSFIRQDIVLNPGAVQFGTVTRGQEASKDLDMEYAGQADWRIVSISSHDPNLEVTFSELYRKPGRIGYRVTTRLKQYAPAGTFRDVLAVETNDPTSSMVNVTVEGQVQPDIVVTPPTLVFTAKPGQEVTRQVFIRGKTPFHLASNDLAGNDPNFSVKASDAAQSLHNVTVRFVAGQQPGTFERVLRFQTDVPGQAAIELKTRVDVVP